MGDTMINLLIFCCVIIALVLGTIFIAVPLFAAVGAGIGGLFRGIGWVFAHVFGFITGMIRDAVRLVGAFVAFIVFVPFMVLNIAIGRWSASGHFFRSMKRECQVASACCYRLLLQRPLRFLLLGGLLEGIEDRFEEAVANAPPADKPSARTGKFDGYAILGSLPVGGSGAKLYVAEPDKFLRERRPDMPNKVVIKAFALTDGSSLPQIVRESRALEAAKQLGLVLDHGMDEHRFHYVMPYHDGDHLSIVARQLHGESDTGGLAKRELATVIGYVEDLLLTLREYHRAGLWHKDVKPENVIVHDGRAHLVDLGLVTPLRSAMTLTTHGTEYFRDPEMVRQALRGVRVHQVDGTRFDIYAVGAVMYFLLENTFPAHGGLSRFVRKSPESLRWIVRRAMTDYNKRYASVDVMLADIRYVMASSDPAAIKPGELPSMKDGGLRDEAARDADAAAAAAAREAEASEANTTVEASAGSPNANEKKSAFIGRGIAAGIGAHGPFVQVGALNLDENGEPIEGDRPAMRRPRLRVTNWWTGAYVPDEELNKSAPAAPAPARAASHHAKAASHAPFVPTGPRRPASTQVAAAQARAASISKRAAQRRARFMDKRQGARHASEQRTPSAFIGLVVMLACIFGGVYVVRSVVNERRSDNNVFAADMPSVSGAYAGVLTGGFDNVDAPWPLIVINDHPAKTNPVVMGRIEKFLADREDGWEFLSDDLDAEARVRSMLPTGDLKDFSKLAVGPLNELLQELNVFGVLHLSAGPGDAPPQDRLRAAFIMCPEGEYDRPLLVRAAAIPVTDIAPLPSTTQGSDAVIVSMPQPPPAPKSKG
jgi:serine/threonine protein kinase